MLIQIIFLGLFCSAIAPSTPVKEETFEPKKKFDDDELIERLAPVEYYLTRKNWNEATDFGHFRDFYDPGYYHCVVCDQKLFSSNHKYELGLGAATFHYAMGDLVEFEDTNDTFVVRGNTIYRTKETSEKMTSIACEDCGAHLGHVDYNMYRSRSGKEYKVNSHALNFKPAIVKITDKYHR